MPNIDISPFTRDILALPERAPCARIRLLAFDEIDVGSERGYLVKGLIPRVGLVTAWGPPKSGKSFWAFDLAMHVALGRPYRGRRVTGGPVVYVAAEGASGFRARIAAFRKERLGDGHEGPVPFYLVPLNLDLIEENETLIDAVTQSLGAGSPPAAVVIDTLNRTLRGSEARDEDMAAYIAAADAIRTAFDCAVIVVHHCGLDTSRPRGHTSLGGAVDAQLAIKRDAAGTIVTTVEFMKDGPEGDTVSSRLVSVELGIDQDGDPITSCVVEAVEDGDAPAETGPRLSSRQRRALNVLRNILADHGEPAPDAIHFPARATVVPVETWREHLLKTGVLDPGASNPRQPFFRLKDALSDKGVICEWDGYIWIDTVTGAVTSVPFP